MTTANKWTFGAVGVVVLVLVASWFLLVSPQLSEASELSDQTAAQENANAALRTDIAVLEDQYKDLPEKQAQLKALDQQIPATDELSQYIQTLSLTADDSDVAMSSVTPTGVVSIASAGSTTAAAPVPGQGLPADQLAGMNVDIVVTGDYFAIQEFVNKMEELERYTLIAGLAIVEPESTTEGADSGDLTATINARIYMVPQPLEAAAITDPAAATTTAETTP